MDINKVNDKKTPIYCLQYMLQRIIIENGDIRLANPNDRSPYSSYEIRLLPSTIIQSYKNLAFNPIMTIAKQEICDVIQLPHDLYVGMLKYFKTAENPYIFLSQITEHSHLHLQQKNTFTEYLRKLILSKKTSLIQFINTLIKKTYII